MPDQEPRVQMSTLCANMTHQLADVCKDLGVGHGLLLCVVPFPHKAGPVSCTRLDPLIQCVVAQIGSPTLKPLDGDGAGADVDVGGVVLGLELWGGSGLWEWMPVSTAELRVMCVDLPVYRYMRVLLGSFQGAEAGGRLSINSTCGKGWVCVLALARSNTAVGSCAAGW